MQTYVHDRSILSGISCDLFIFHEDAHAVGETGSKPVVSVGAIAEDSMYFLSLRPPVAPSSAKFGLILYPLFSNEYVFENFSYHDHFLVVTCFCHFKVINHLLL